MTKLTDKILLEAEKYERKQCGGMQNNGPVNTARIGAIQSFLSHLKQILKEVESKEAVEDKEIKADGYVAWKPSGAFDQSFEVVKGDGSCLAGHKGEVVTDGMQYEYIEIYKTPHQVERFADPFRRKMANEGWKIRPVKLVFLDTAKESGEQE